MVAAACEVKPAPDPTTTTTSLNPPIPRIATTTSLPTPPTTAGPAPTTTVISPSTTLAPDVSTTVPEASTTTSAPPTSTTTTTPVPWEADAPNAHHVMKRLTYGPTLALSGDLAAKGWTAWLDEQLDPASINDDEIETLLAGYETLTAANTVNKQRKDLTVAELRHSALLRAVHSNRQLNEIMVRFWSDHFNTDAYEWYGFLKADEDRNTFRVHALGKFSDLLVGSAKSPAMLLYLNNADSHFTDGVIENWARELLELHTLGLIDGEQPYSEEDMRTVAYLVAGWGIDWDTYTFEWHPWAASGEAYSILDGAWSRPARADRNDGEADVMDLLGFLAHHPNTAQHVAWKLCRHFVSDDPPSSLVTSAADVYLASDTEIAPVLRHILTSDEFAASANQKLRRPMELLTCMLRAFETDIPVTLGTGASQIDRHLADMGHNIFGWTLPDGYPDVADRWISSQASLLRWRTAIRCLSGGFHWGSTPAEEQVNTDIQALYDQSAETAGALVEQLGARLIGYVPDPAIQTAVLSSVGATVDTPAASIRNDERSASTLAAVMLCVPEVQYR